MKIMLLGAAGVLGGELLKVLEGDVVIPLTHADIEITESESVRQALERHRPEVVINTTAYHKTDECETQVEKTFRVNTYAVRDLALACHQHNATLAHISTDLVFGGEKHEPYLETDLPCPLSVYANAKLAGEHFVKTLAPRHFLIRTCGIYALGGSKSKGGNFAITVLRRAAEGKPLRVVDDQVVTPTYAVDLARKISELIRTDAYGLYHVSSNGACSWFEFARRVFEIAGVKADLGTTTTDAIKQLARRPAYSVLRNYNLEKLGLEDMPTWENALERFLVELRKSGDVSLGLS